MTEHISDHKRFDKHHDTAQDWAEANFDKELLTQIWSSQNYNHQDHSPHVLARFRARGIYNVSKRAHAVAILEEMMNELYKEVRGEEPPTMDQLIEDEGDGMTPSDASSESSMTGMEPNTNSPEVTAKLDQESRAFHDQLIASHSKAQTESKS